jgi:hypothetical protein
MNGNSDRSRAFLRNTSLAVTSPHSPQRITCDPSAVVQPRAAILFRCYSNGSRAFILSIYLEVTSRQIFRARFSLWRHIFPAIHPMFQRNQRGYHVKKTSNVFVFHAEWGSLYYLLPLYTQKLQVSALQWLSPWDGHFAHLLRTCLGAASNSAKKLHKQMLLIFGRSLTTLRVCQKPLQMKLRTCSYYKFVRQLR